MVDPGCNNGDGDGDGYTVATGDCSDSNAAIYPGAPELCDSLDNDCNGQMDENCGVDADGDGYGAYEGDCDDSNPLVFPNAAEPCDGVDNDCDGVIF